MPILDNSKPTIEFFGWGQYDYEKNAEAEKAGTPPIQLDVADFPEEIRSHLWYVFEKKTIEEIVRKKYRFSGDTHQRSKHGCPIFLVDGKKVYYPNSMRAWGAVMASAWDEIEQVSKYDYMDFYMECFLGKDEKDKPVLPVVGKDIDETGKNLQ